MATEKAPPPDDQAPVLTRIMERAREATPDPQPEDDSEDELEPGAGRRFIEAHFQGEAPARERTTQRKPLT